MTDISGLGNRNIRLFQNTNVGMGGVEGTNKSEKSDEKNGLTLSETDGKSQVNQPSMPDIETPNPDGYSPEEIDSIINKLGKDVFNFDGEDLEAFNNSLHDTVNKLTNKMTESVSNQQGDAQGTNQTEGTQKQDQTEGTQEQDQTEGTQEQDQTNGTQQSNQTSGVNLKGSSKVMFDIYQMLALLLECAQSLKNSERDIRLAENAQVINAITQQANAQRTAAWTGIIAGGIVCALQVGASVYSTVKTVSNVGTDNALTNEFGVKDAAAEVNAAQTELNDARTELKEYNTEHPVPGEGAEPEAADVTQHRTQLENKVNDARTELMNKKVSFESKVTEMKNSTRYQELQKSQAWIKGFSEITFATGNMLQTLVRGATDLQMANAVATGADEKKAEEELAQTKDLMSSFQDVITQALQLLQAVQQAENESMNEAIHA